MKGFLLEHGCLLLFRFVSFPWWQCPALKFGMHGVGNGSCGVASLARCGRGWCSNVHMCRVSHLSVVSKCVERPTFKYGPILFRHTTSAVEEVNLVTVASTFDGCMAFFVCEVLSDLLRRKTHQKQHHYLLTF